MTPLASPVFAATDQCAQVASAPIRLADRRHRNIGYGADDVRVMGAALDHNSPGMIERGVGIWLGFGDQIVPCESPEADDVRHVFEHRLELQSYKRLKIGDVNRADEDSIIAKLTTVDSSVIDRLEVIRHTGKIRHPE